MRLMINLMPALIMVLCAANMAVAQGEKYSTVHSMSISEAFERGLGAWDARLADDGKGLVLYDHTLIEDDGPGISSDVSWLVTDRAPVTKVGGETRIKKVLHVERPEALAAHLYVQRGLNVEINGQPVDLPANSFYPEIPAELIRKGNNEIVLHYPEKSSERTVKMARYEDIYRNAPERRNAPPRSFISTNGGKTWQPAEGEYMVRLHLVQYAKKGRMISPTFDLGKRQEDDSLLLNAVEVNSATLALDAECPEGTAVSLAVRTGPCPIYDEKLWTDWQKPDADGRIAKIPAGHRYLQWQATLTSNDPTKTPLLKAVTVQAVVTAAPSPRWAEKLSVIDSHNADIFYTSIPFEYEDPQSPAMVALRRKYKLDEVVAGAKTELEKMVKLRNWVAHQWRFTAPAKNYPAWDADEILTRKYGFCVQYAIVFMQCATALGVQSRFIFGNHSGAIDGGGHEVCEWWSNEYEKWVFFDINQNWHHINPADGTPYSLLEIHDAIIRHYYDGQLADWRKRPRAAKYSPEFATCYGDSVTVADPPARRAWHKKDGLYRVPSRWLNLRYMPRNNYLSQPYPVPMLQGTHWDWSDYIIYSDAQTPREWRHRYFTARRADIAWTINQVRFDASCGNQPGSVTVQMGTSTPYFETFLVKTDDGQWTKSGPKFNWQLKPGSNRLQMRTRNTSGVEGPISFLQVDWKN